MPSTTDQTLDNQNEDELNSLHGKIKALRSVTIDILDDSERQNSQTNTFSSFANSLVSTSRHHSRQIANNSTLRQYRTTLSVVGAVVVLWLLVKLWRASGGHGGGPGEI